MKWKLFSLVTLLFLVLTGCQTDPQGQTGQRYNNDNNNIEQTRYGTGNVGDDGLNGNARRYGNDTGDGFTRDRNYTMDRNIEERNQRNQDNFRNTRNSTNNAQRQNDRYDVADEAADQITSQVEEIENAYVLTTNNNAYVAAALEGNRRNGNDDDVKNNNNRGDDLTEEVKQEIADIVKSVDNDIDNVYVSTNPDFMDLTNNYVNDMNEGRPIEGFFDQMGNMIERLFPQNR